MEKIRPEGVIEKMGLNPLNHSGDAVDEKRLLESFPVTIGRKEGKVFDMIQVGVSNKDVMDLILLRDTEHRGNRTRINQ
jgi:hypothetical protein